MAVDKREKPKLTTCFRDESLCCKNHLLNQIIKLARRKKTFTQARLRTAQEVKRFLLRRILMLLQV
jgi:hypothetical protein